MRRSIQLIPEQVALLCIDLQEDQRRDERYIVDGFDTILGKVALLQATARGMGVPVMHAAFVRDLNKHPLRPFEPITAEGMPAFSAANSPDTAICPEVAPVEGELVFNKNDASAFCEGDLLPILRQLGIEWLLVCGVWTEQCVAATIRDAIDFGIHAVLIKDACGSGSETMHQTAVLNLANRLYGGAVASTDQACAVIEGEAVDLWQLEGIAPIRFDAFTIAGQYEAL